MPIAPHFSRSDINMGYLISTLVGLIAFILPGSVASVLGQQTFILQSGSVQFISEAPLETIKASTGACKGIVNTGSQTFAFSVDMRKFLGFNSDLQLEHFHENYMESEKFPRATFTGKLIDQFDPSLSTQTIRAKGQFEIHGVRKERIIEVTITKENDTFKISSTFGVPLKDHGISVPKIVNQKIAEIISVTLNGIMIEEKK